MLFKLKKSFITKTRTPTLIQTVLPAAAAAAVFQGGVTKYLTYKSSIKVSKLTRLFKTEQQEQLQFSSFSKGKKKVEYLKQRQQLLEAGQMLNLYFFKAL